MTLWAALLVGAVRKQKAIIMNIESETFATLERLNASLEDCNTNDKARVLIQASIDAGIQKGSDIIATLVRLGFSQQHVGATLANGCGNDPERFDWCKQADETYANNC